MDNADHDPPGPAATSHPAGPAHIVSYTGELQQALLDLDSWVTHGAQPPATSGYRITADDQVQVAPTAEQRHGVQPVLTLTAHAHGDQSAEGSVTAHAGEAVTFTVRATDPQGAGKITRIEWDYTGAGSFPVSQQPSRIAAVVSATGTYTFPTPGTYYVYVRVTSQQDGNPDTPYGQVQNLAGIQVIVR
jgi:hypothetical protein